MTNHHLSVEQRFHLEAAFREIDACQDLEKLREITKQIITAHENERAFAREAIRSSGKKWSSPPQKNSVLIGGKAELPLDWLDRISLERGLQWWNL